MESITTAFQDIKSAFRKNIFLLILFIGLIIFALIGVFATVVGGIGYSQFKELGGEIPVPASGGDMVEEDDTALITQSAVSGVVRERTDTSLVVEIALADGTTTELQFAMTSDTNYTLLVIADGDTSGGVEQSIGITDIAVGDTVTVYTNEEIGSIAPQSATSVTKVGQS